MQWLPQGGGLNTEALEVPIGTIIAFMGNTPPENYLACDGNTYRIADYKPVANFINLQFGSFNYFGGDGVDTFAVPDLRGEFLRGTGANSHKNAFGELQGSGSAVGVHQNGTRNNVCVTYNGAGSASDTGWLGTYIPPKSTPYSVISPIDTDFVLSNSAGIKAYSATLVTDSFWQKSPTVHIARPTNTSVLYCIKYKNS